MFRYSAAQCGAEQGLLIILECPLNCIEYWTLSIYIYTTASIYVYNKHVFLSFKGCFLDTRYIVMYVTCSNIHLNCHPVYIELNCHPVYIELTNCCIFLVMIIINCHLLYVINRVQK